MTTILWVADCLDGLVDVLLPAVHAPGGVTDDDLVRCYDFPADRTGRG